ncbi:MAG: hypothetical protein LUQ40_05235 [Methanomicrobiales archaeon]|nr:hypothetical protein [Methanomicrobiales archaeon]
MKEKDMERVPPAEGYAARTCSHCEGAGCIYCYRRGFVYVLEPTKKCPHCEGDGCIYCGFTGWAGTLVEKWTCKKG